MTQRKPDGSAGDADYGTIGGEFRFELPPLVAGEIPGIAGQTATLTDYPVVDLGAALLIKL